MNHLDLFSGIGGFSLAASWAWGKDHNIIAFVERDKYCQKVLNKHWPDVPIIGDIHDYRHETLDMAANPIKRQGEKKKPASGESVDLLTGGFP